MDGLSTNVLVIGRSGVGKSSLLNYLFEREIQKTGSGGAVTRKGIFPFKYKYDENFSICIYDTWGLEPDKTDEWKNLIVEEVKEHDKSKVSEWFNTIIYCLSANSERVEDFEIAIIKSLVDLKNQMIIAITHCDNREDSRAEVMKNRIVRCTGVNEKQVVFVSNVEKKLIGKRVQKFGREDVFSVIIRNLWNSLKVKVPFNVKTRLRKSFFEEREFLNSTISNKWLLFRRDTTLKEFENDVNSEFQKFLKDEMDAINKQFIDALYYYNSLSMKYAEISLLDKDSIINMPEMHFEALGGFKKEVNSQVEIIRKNYREVYEWLDKEFSRETIQEFWVTVKKYFSSSRTVKDSLRETIEAYMIKAENIMNEQIIKIEEQLQRIDIERVQLLMLDRRE